jgi:hypothetical protein
MKNITRAFICCLLILVYNLQSQTSFPNLNINNITFTNGNHLYTSPSGIVSPSDNTSSIVTQNADVTFKAAQNIRLKPGFSAASLTGNGSFLARIGQDFEIVIMSPTTNPGEVPKLEKLELGIKLPPALQAQIDQYLANNTGINPYDPDQIHIRTIFESPAGSSYGIDGFYYEDFVQDPSGLSWNTVATDYPFRVRFAAPAVGSWKGYVNILIGGSTVAYSSFTFNCVPSSNKGYLIPGQFGQRLRFSVTGQSFFAVGQNIAWPETSQQKARPFEYNLQKSYIHDLHVKQGNYVRLVLAPWSSAVEFEKMGDYTDRQPHLWELDRIFDQAHAEDLYIHLCMEMHTQYEESNPFGAPRWAEHPYNSANQSVIPGIIEPVDFFTNADAKKYFKNRLRYIVARWGYSTNLVVYEMMSEIDKINDYATIPVKAAVNNWHIEMINYVKSNLDIRHLFSTSYAGAPDHVPPFITPLYDDPAISLTSRHSYADPNPSHPNVNYDARFNDMVSDVSDLAHPIFGLDLYGKPYIFGEMGGAPEGHADNCSDLDFHNSLWATSFMGGYGSGLNWWHWYDNNYRSNITGVASFMGMFNLDDSHYTPRKYSRYGTVQCFMLQHNDGALVIGWLNNMRNNSYHTLPCGPGLFSDIEHKEKINIDYLKAGRSYDLTFYSINHTGPVATHSQFSVTTNVFGNYKRKVWPLIYKYEDYAFKLALNNFREDHSLEPDTITCPTDTIFANGIYEDDVDGTQYSYFWNFGNGNTSTLAHPKIYYGVTGSYNVQLIVQDSLGIFDTLTQTIVIMPCDPLPTRIMIDPQTKLEPNENLQIFPNPSRSFCKISSANTFSKVEIYSALGILISQINPTENIRETDIDLQSLSPGVYIVTIYLGNCSRQSAKLIVQ